MKFTYELLSIGTIELPTDFLYIKFIHNFGRLGQEIVTYKFLPMNFYLQIFTYRFLPMDITYTYIFISKLPTNSKS